MSSLKSELMRVSANNIGDQVENLLERAKQGIPECEGGIKQALQFSEDMDGLSAHVKTDIAEGKYDLETAKHVMLYVSRAKEIALNHVERQRRERLVASGRIEALVAALAQIKKAHDGHANARDADLALEAAAREAARSGTEEGAKESRFPPPLRQRKAEEEAAEALATTKKKSKRGKNS